MVYFGKFYCPYRPLMYVRNKWQPETKPLRTPYMLVRLELKPFIEVYCFLSLIWKAKQWSKESYVQYINKYGQYIFWLFIRWTVLTWANKVTELSFDFKLQIIYFLEYQNFASPSSKQEFFDVIRKYPEVINPNCFFMLFS